MPFFPVFAAAPKVDHSDDEAVIEQNARLGVESWFDVDAVSAIPGDEAGIRPVELRLFRNHDVHRYFRSVLARREFANDSDVGEIDDRRRGERKLLGLA